MTPPDDHRAPEREPTEPFVFECRACGKVFEARTRRAYCPECESADVERLTD